MAKQTTDEFSDFELPTQTADEFAGFESVTPTIEQPGIVSRITKDIYNFATSGELLSGLEEGTRRLGKEVLTTAAQMEPTLPGGIDTPASIGFETPEQTAQRAENAKRLSQSYEKQFPKIPLKTGTAEFVADIVGTLPLNVVSGGATGTALRTLSAIPKVGPVLGPVLTAGVVAPALGVLQAQQSAAQQEQDFTLDDAKRVAAFGVGLGLGTTALVGAVRGARGVFAARATKAAKASEEAFIKQPTLETKVNPVVGDSTLVDVTNRQIKNLQERKAQITAQLEKNTVKYQTKQTTLQQLDNQINNLNENYTAQKTALQQTDEEIAQLQTETRRRQEAIARLAPVEKPTPELNVPAQAGPGFSKQPTAINQPPFESYVQMPSETGIGTTIGSAMPGAGKVLRRPGQGLPQPPSLTKGQAKRRLGVLLDEEQRQKFIAKNEQQAQIAQQRIEKLTKLRQAKAQELSTDYERELNTLIKRRAKLVKKSDGLPIEKIDALTDEIMTIDNQIAALETELGTLRFKYKTIPKIVTSLTNSAEQATEAAAQKVRDLQNFVKLGVITQDQYEKIAPAVMQELSKIQGVIPKSQWLLAPLNINWVVNATSTFNKMQRKTGVGVGSTAEQIVTIRPQMQNYRSEQLAKAADPINKLVKMGVNEDQITQRLQYIESLPDGSMRFNPSAVDIKGTKIPAWSPDVPPPSQQELDELFKLRQWFDDIATDTGVERRTRYIPIRLKLEKANYSGLSAQNVANPTFEQARVAGELIPGVTETNIKTLLGRYTNDVARSKFMKPVLQKSVGDIVKLRLLGHGTDAAVYEDYLVDALGLKNRDALQRAVTAGLFEDMAPSVRAALKAGNLDDAATENAMTQLFDRFTESASLYGSGLSTRVWMLQIVQPESTLSALTGFVNVVRARKKILGLVGADKDRSVRLARMSNAEGLYALEGFGKADATASIPKLIDTLNAPAKKIAGLAMGKTETYNRRLGVAAADIVFDDAWAKGGTAALEGRAFANLTSSQKELVRQAFRTGGKEAARDAFAVITTNRANMIYNIADKPKALRLPILRRVLFTTYMRGIQSQVFDAVTEGRFGSLADLVVQPMMFNAILASLTGGTLIPGMQPLSSVASLRDLELTPGSVLAFKQKDIGKALNLLPIIGPIKAVERAVDRTYLEKAEDPLDFIFKSYK